MKSILFTIVSEKKIFLHNIISNSYNHSLDFCEANDDSTGKSVRTRTDCQCEKEWSVAGGQLAETNGGRYFGSERVAVGSRRLLFEQRRTTSTDCTGCCTTGEIIVIIVVDAFIVNVIVFLVVVVAIVVVIIIAFFVVILLLLIIITIIVIILVVIVIVIIIFTIVTAAVIIMIPFVTIVSVDIFVVNVIIMT